MGAEPTALAGELSPPEGLPELPADLPVGVPSDLLRRRPDIRQAERSLAAANAAVGVATAQLFPQFSITGSLGLDSSDLKHLPEWSSRYYSIAPGIRWPILDWTRLRAAIRVENEEQAQARLAYESAVAQALKEVEDALVQYEAERGRQAALTEAARQSVRARDVSAQIYAQGLADQLATLQAERDVLQAEDVLAQSEAGLGSTSSRSTRRSEGAGICRIERRLAHRSGALFLGSATSALKRGSSCRSRKDDRT